MGDGSLSYTDSDSSTGNDEDNEDNPTDSGLLSSIINGFSDIAEKIANLPTLIGEIIIDGIKGIFVPSDGFIEEKLELLKTSFTEAFGVTAYDMSLIFEDAQGFEDITCTMYGQTVTIVDMDNVVKGILKFRPVIRGFIVLLMIYYNINQCLSFIGQGSIEARTGVSGGGIGGLTVNGGCDTPLLEDNRKRLGG